ncbi:hypothetical protein KSS87_023353 [Heliosperma pusillum]|nr:hypothetical protein KSS87_023353 [Heliosperma pusillum]
MRIRRNNGYDIFWTRSKYPIFIIRHGQLVSKLIFGHCQLVSKFTICHTHKVIIVRIRENNTIVGVHLFIKRITIFHYQSNIIRLHSHQKYLNLILIRNI